MFNTMISIFKNDAECAYSCYNQFIGASGSNWQTASNWSKGTVPVATDDVLISGVTVGTANTNGGVKRESKTVRIQNGGAIVMPASGRKLLWQTANFKISCEAGSYIKAGSGGASYIGFDDGVDSLQYVSAGSQLDGPFSYTKVTSDTYPNITMPAPCC
jgi:hypothetical protein